MMPAVAFSEKDTPYIFHLFAFVYLCLKESNRLDCEMFLLFNWALDQLSVKEKKHVCFCYAANVIIHGTPLHIL